MPVTFKIAAHGSETFKPNGVEKPTDILKATWQHSSETFVDMSSVRITTLTCKDLIQSSLPKDAEPNNFSPRNNGFLQAIVSAYNGHHNLVIRPDDVWIAILSQFSLYVNANAEALRSKFVSHEGKEKIIVYDDVPSRCHVSYDWMAKEMTKEMKKKIVDPELQSFIVPNFTTTTPVDTAIGCIMMMGTLKHYFNYVCSLDCGIPSMTLLGTREDYEDIHTRLDKFEGFGDEPRVFAALLRPIIREFIEAFYFNDTNGNPDATPPNPEFWGRICHYKTGDSGPDYLSGWATAFCVWDDDGKWQGPKLATFADPISERERLESNAFYEAHPTSRDDFEVYSPPPVFFGEVRYPVLDFSKVPNGFCEVDVLVDEYGTEFDCTMVAGHVGFTVSGERSDTLQPSPQWFMFEKEEVVENINLGIPSS